MSLRKLILAFGLSVGLTAGTAIAADDTLLLDLESGRVTIKLRPDLAPKHVAQMKKLASRKFFDGTVFHRVIPGFMAQGGDPTGTGQGVSTEKNLPAEFTNAPYKRGTIGMARSSDPNSANSQFFICFTDDGCSNLTGQYTVWAEVTGGMELIDGLAAGEPPQSPSKIVRLQVAK